MIKKTKRTYLYTLFLLSLLSLLLCHVRTSILERSNAVLQLVLSADDIETDQHPWMAQCPLILRGTAKYFLKDKVKKVFFNNTHPDADTLDALCVLRSEIEHLEFYLFSLDSKCQKAISNMTNLRTLRLNSFKLDSLDFIKNLRSLEMIFVSHNDSFESGQRITLDLEPLKNLNSLEYLLLCDVPAKGLDKLDKLVFLTELDLEYNHLTDITFLKNYKSLKRLNISGNDIADLKPLVNLNLEFLDFRDTQVKTISPIKNMMTLKEVYLNHLVTDTDIEELQKALPNCILNPQ